MPEDLLFYFLFQGEGSGSSAGGSGSGGSPGLSQLLRQVAQSGGLSSLGRLPNLSGFPGLPRFEDIPPAVLQSLVRLAALPRSVCLIKSILSSCLLVVFDS